MEDQKVNDKLRSDGEKALHTLGVGYKDLTKLMSSAFESIDESLKTVLDDKQLIRAKAFQDKYAVHIVKGEISEAEELKKEYLKQENAK